MGVAFLMNLMLMIGSLRLNALCLMATAVSSVSQAKPVAFKPSVELTDSVNVFAPIWVDADGDGVSDYTGYDYRLNKIVSCVQDPRGIHWPKKRMIIEGGNPDYYSGPFRYDLDGDGKQDLLTTQGRHIVWWKVMSGAPLAYQGTWGDPLPSDRFVASIEDMDKDGNPDVLLFPRVLEGALELIPDPGLVGYGSPTGSFTWLEVDFETPAQEHPASEFHDVNGDGALDWIFSDKVALLEGRQLLGVVALPSSHFNIKFADIDGLPGVELVSYQGYEGKSVIFPDSGDGSIRLLKFQDGTWTTLADQSFAFDGFFPEEPAYYGVHVGNFDADPEQEIAVVAREMLITLDYKQGVLAADAIYFFAENLKDWDMVTVVDREPDGRDSLLVESFPSAKDAGWVLVSDGAPMWKHMEISQEPFGQSYASAVGISHYPRSFAVVKMDGGPRIASLGKYDQALHVWQSPIAADRHTIAVSGKQGIGLLAGRFRGGDVEELAWLSSDEDSASEFSIGTKDSLIEVKTPSFTGSSSSSQYRKRSYSGQMPATLLGKADFNGDGKDDLLFTNPEDGMMTWGSGHDLGALKHEVGYMPLIAKYETLHGAGPENVVVYDMDQDGDPDILQFPSVFGNAVAQYTNDGAGQFSVSRLGSDASDIPVGHIPVAIASGNFDGAGAPDITVLSVSGIFYDSPSVLRIMRDGNPEISELVNLEGNVARLVVADFNGDGLDDIVFTGGYSIDSFGMPMWGTPPCQILARKNSSSFHSPVMISDSLWPCSSLAAADVNGDGKADLIHGSSMTGTVTYLEAATVETMPTFAEWAVEMEVSDQDADNDGDGASNFYEYLTGRDPNVVDPNLHSGAVPGEAPVINLDRDERYMSDVVFSLNATHQRPANLPQGTAHVVLESSANLRDWIPVDDEPTKTLTKGYPGWETLRWDTYDGLLEEEHGKFYRFRTWVE
jgi:hypothetical protein